MNQKMNKLKDILNNHGIILIPTDTIWWLSCLVTSDLAINKISKVKQREQSKTMIILVSDNEMLGRYINKTDNIISQNFDFPTTVIYKYDKLTDFAKSKISTRLIKDDDTVTIRVVWDNNKELSQIISLLWMPLVSTSANISWQPSPIQFEDIDKTIIDSVDYIYHMDNRTPKTKPSNIIKIENNEIIYIRK